MKKNKTEQIAAIVIAILFLSIIGAANYITVFSMDDLWYSTNLSSGEELHSFRDIIEGQIWHYFNWGGRSVAHSFLQLSILGGRVFADICNILCFLVLIGLLCGKRKSQSGNILWDWILVGGMLISLNANWQQTLLWQSGVANYLYTTTIVVAFLWIYFRAMEKKQNSQSKSIWGILFSSVAMLLFGSLAGWTNENMGPMVFLVTLLISVQFIREKRKDSVWMIMGCIGSFAGSVVMILAPGNQVRSETIVSDKTMFANILQRVVTFLYASQKYLWAAIIALFLLWCISRFLLKVKMDNITVIISCGALVSYLLMIASPHYPDRATFGTLVLIIWVAKRMMNNMCDKNEDMNKVKILLASLFSFNAIYMYTTYVLQMKKIID